MVTGQPVRGEKYVCPSVVAVFDEKSALKLVSSCLL
jgi:hypothetical protein